jgi:hypothetical protein
VKPGAAVVAYVAGALAWLLAASLAMFTLHRWTEPHFFGPGSPWVPGAAAVVCVLAGAALVMYAAGAAPRRVAATAVVLQAVALALVGRDLVHHGTPGMMRLVLAAAAVLLGLAAVARPVSRPSAPR